MQHLTGKELERLTKLCGLFSSHHPAEVAEAARKADQFLRERGLQWSDVIRLPALPKPDTGNGNGWDTELADASDAEQLLEAMGGWNAAVGFCLKHRKQLTKWELAFCLKISSWYSISPKQRPVLGGICSKLVDQGCRP
jgi:hypothetical protein